MGPQQAALPVYEDEMDAIRDVVRAIGGTKVAGHGLRPDFSPDAAGAWLKDCLNPERREKLAPSQVMRLLRLARDIGYHAPMQFIAAEIGYAVTPTDPADEMAELQRQFIASVAAQKGIAERIERLTRSPLAAVKA